LPATLPWCSGVLGSRRGFGPDATRGPIMSAHPSTGAPGVLVVDDDQAILQSLEVGLRASGFQVWASLDPEEALRLVAEHRASIDGGVLEVVMPGCGGPELLVRLRAIAPVLPAVLISGYLAVELPAGAGAPLLPKPFRLPDLVGLIRQEISRLGARGA